jgi:hypothetical protein
MIRRAVQLLFFGLICHHAFAQEYLFPLNRDVQTRIEHYLQPDSDNFHSSLKPYTYAEMRAIAPVDSVFASIIKDNKFSKTLVGRKIFKEHLFDVDKDDIHFCVDPVFNFEAGRDLINDVNAYTNTRGILIQADVKQKFFLYTGFTENRTQYIDYLNDFVSYANVAPGQGRVKPVSRSVYDYSNARGGIGYTLNRHFDFLLAHDKNFMGDGYRSLLLSDNAYNYPFLRMNMTFWKFKYSVIYTSMLDGITDYDVDNGYTKKFARFSYIDVNIGRKNTVSLGIFEALITRHDASRSFDFNYINPVIFLRPVEYSVGSPDNELLGANVKIKINSRNILYGQLMLDEFVLSEIRKARGWWGNKQGLQGGYKSFNVLRIKNLNIQTELNFVRPYTYQHKSIGTSYTHYNQPLAHPLGANFIESVSFINYRWKNFFVEAKLLYSVIGKDRLLENNGNNVYNDYTIHGDEYGHHILDVIKTTLIYNDLRVNYLINPKTNLNLELGVTDRTYTNDFAEQSSRFVYFGLRTSLENYYFDF